MVRSLLLVLGLLFFGGTPAFAETPRECVEKIGVAIDTADTGLFTQKVDVDALINDSIAVFLEAAKKPEMQRNMQPMLAIMLQQAASGQGAGATIRALLYKEGRAFLLNGIGSGAFAGKKVSYTKQQSLLTPLFEHASLGRKEIVQIGAGQKRADGTIVPFTILDYGNDLEYPVDGLIQDVQGTLRLTKILNLQEIFTRIQEEAAQYAE